MEIQFVVFMLEFWFKDIDDDHDKHDQGKERKVTQ